MCLCLSYLGAKAQATHWSVNIYNYQYDMSAYVTLTDDGQAVTDYSGCEIAAFCGDECRGVGEIQTVQTATYVYLRIRSNSSSGENINFKVYVKSTGREVDVKDYAMPFVSQSVQGLPSSPVVLNYVPTIPLIVFNETDNTAPATSEDNVKVTVNRTILANEWSTICLPFAMTADQVKDAFGNDVQLGDFAGYDLLEDGSVINVNFNIVNAIEANHPYIIKVSAAVSQFDVTGVQVLPSSSPQVNFGTDTEPKAFIGNYINGTTLPSGCLFLNGGKFWYSVGLTKMKAFRAYFNFTDLLPSFKNREVPARVFITIDGDATGIMMPSVQQSGNDAVYNLCGQRVSQPATLQKGIYIINGKKVSYK